MVSGLLIGYARVSTDEQDLTAQRDALTVLGIAPERMPDARDIVAELTAREVKLSLGWSVHDPTDPVGRLLFNVLAMVAEFESDLIKMRTRPRASAIAGRSEHRSDEHVVSIRTGFGKPMGRPSPLSATTLMQPRWWSAGRVYPVEWWNWATLVVSAAAPASARGRRESSRRLSWHARCAAHWR